MIKNIKIGGSERPVRYSINALIEFEELTGIDITTTEGREKMTSMKSIRALAFVGLKHGLKSEKKELSFTIEDVGDWLDTSSQNEILIAFTDSSSGDEDKEGDGKK